MRAATCCAILTAQRLPLHLNVPLCCPVMTAGEPRYDGVQKQPYVIDEPEEGALHWSERLDYSDLGGNEVATASGGRPAPPAVPDRPKESAPRQSYLIDEPTGGVPIHLRLDYSDLGTIDDLYAAEQMREYSQHSPMQHEQPVYVQASFDFPAEQAGDLALRAGDIIVVTQQGEPDGWWEGSLNGQIGWFPATYCSAPYY